MRNNKPVILLMSLLISACHTQPVFKKDVEANNVNARDGVIALQEKDPATVEDLRKFDNESENFRTFKPENIIKIQGNDRGLKFIDPTWSDFPITIDLNVVPIRTFFQSLQRMTKINFVVGDDVKGDVTINLKDVSWIEAYQIVMKNKNLIGDVNATGNVVIIHTPEFISDQSASSQKAIKARIDYDKSVANLEAKETSIIRLNFARPETIQLQLREIISRIDTSSTTMPGGAGGGSSTIMMSNRASFILDARTNSIVVHATAADMEWIKSAIANLDRPTKQVLVDVFIVEATDDFQAQIGSRLTYAQSGSGSNLLGRPTSLGVGGLGGASAMGIGPFERVQTPFQTVQNLGNLTNNALLNPLGSFGVIMNSDTTRLGAELQAMQEEQLIKIVSNPKLFIVDNETASIADGTEIPFVIGGSLGVAPQTQFKEALLKMEVRPTITGEGNVYMSITVNKDSPISGTQPPAISKKQLVTKLIIRDGGIAMIGGINKSEASSIENGVPLFGKIPLLGNLFKSKADKKNQNQMYIFLAPKVL